MHILSRLMYGFSLSGQVAANLALERASLTGHGCLPRLKHPVGSGG